VRKMFWEAPAYPWRNWHRSWWWGEYTMVGLGDPAQPPN
jgi:hypothetical protein